MWPVEARKTPVKKTVFLTYSALRKICSTNRVPCTAATKRPERPGNSRYSSSQVETNCHAISFSHRKRGWIGRQNSVPPLCFESQRRHFFSIFRGVDLGKEVPTKESRTQISIENENKSDNIITFTTSTSSRCSKDDIYVNRDWEDQFRRPISPELWKEFQNECQRTRNYLSSPPPSSKQSIPSSLPKGYNEILLELHATIHETWNGPGALEPPREHGPTGKWLYWFEFSDNGSNRMYQRCPILDVSMSEDVLELPPNAETIAMSLTPDEACIACLLQPEGDSSAPRIILRSVETKKESNFSGTEWLRGLVKHPSDVVGLEWGPILKRETLTVDFLENHSDADFIYSLYLLLADHQGRPDRVALCHIHPLNLTLITPPTVIYSSDDPAVMVDIQRTKGCAFISIRSLSKTSSEVFLSQGDRDVVLVRPRQDGVVYHVDVGKEGDLVLLTSDERHANGGDYFLEEVSVSALPLPATTETPLSPPLDDEEYFVEDIDLFLTHIVLYERSRKSGEQRVRLRKREHGDQNGNSMSRDTILDWSSFSSGNFKSSSIDHIEIPPYWSKLSPIGNMCFESSFFRFELESPASPGVVYEYDFDSQQLTMVSRSIDGNGAIESREPNLSCRSFQKEIVQVESLDGTRVPLTLFSKKQNNGEAQTASQIKTIVLVGYGAYGEPMDLGYNPGWKPLLDRGVGIAFAHTRGGGDLGRAWYANGRNEHKLRGIEDYEACAHYLRERFDANLKNERKSFSLVAKAFSAGGILVGAAINRNPGLFDKVIFTNAFVDLASTMGRPDLFLTEHEYDEFGNPNCDPVTKARIQSYCPVHNLHPTVQCQETSTRFLIIGTIDDPNVPYWNASLYFRKLLEGFKGKPMVGGKPTTNDAVGQEEVLYQNDRVFLELQKSGGHHLSGPNRIDVLALENTFILKD